jgi:pimeloyl-ACP methyl ester carboxylesterase
MLRVQHALSCAGIALLSAGACITQEVGSDPPATPVEETVASFGRRPISWEPCKDDPALLCGTLVVPLDYRDRGGGTLDVAAIKAPATGAKRGSLFVNPGGPGGSGVDLVLIGNNNGLFAKLRESFDIVSFDPRGTGRSGEVICKVTLPPPASSGSLEAQAAVADETSRRVATSCSEQNGALTLMGTTNVARDIDVFRVALGELELNYLGYSYGTILGAEYATQFPNRVRAMVLDGNVAPSWIGDSLLEIDAEGSSSAEQAFHRLDELCKRDSKCPLRQAGVIKTFERLVAKLDQAPIVVPDGIFDGRWLRDAIFADSYAEFLWPSNVYFLTDVDSGDFVQFLRPRPPDSLMASFSGSLATICDDSSTRRAALTYLPQQAATNASFPHFGGANFGDAPTLCSQWPEAERVPLRNATTPSPIVLIGNDYDPATPLGWSRNMAAALGAKARLVRYQGGGHTIYGSGSACIDDAVNAYFIDLIPPDLGLTCPALPLSFGPTRSARSTQPMMSEVLQEIAGKNRRQR